MDQLSYDNGTKKIECREHIKDTDQLTDQVNKIMRDIFLLEPLKFEF